MYDQNFKKLCADNPKYAKDLLDDAKKRRLMKKASRTKKIQLLEQKWKEENALRENR